MGANSGFAPQSSPQPANHFPVVNSSDLNGRALSLPKDLPGERTILIVAFQREQQADVDTWTTGLHLADGKTPWLELPVIDNPGVIGRWFIDTGMRRGIPSTSTRAHVVTVYTSKTEFKKAIGISSEATVYALVVDRQGTILTSIAGRFSEAGAETILAAIRG